jgi:hypothetical protein
LPVAIAGKICDAFYNGLRLDASIRRRLLNKMCAGRETSSGAVNRAAFLGALEETCG